MAEVMGARRSTVQSVMERHRETNSHARRLGNGREKEDRVGPSRYLISISTTSPGGLWSEQVDRKMDITRSCF